MSGRTIGGREAFLIDGAVRLQFGNEGRGEAYPTQKLRVIDCLCWLPIHTSIGRGPLADGHHADRISCTARSEDSKAPSSPRLTSAVCSPQKKMRPAGLAISLANALIWPGA